MALKLITAPTVEPISLTEAKEHLRISHSDEDNIISLYIRAARQYVEGPYGYLGRALVTQTWDLILDEFPDNEIKIPLPPLQAVSSVNYFDATGTELTVSTDDYYVDTASDPGWIVPVDSWPTGVLDAVNSVRIRFVAGYPVTADSPPSLTGNIPFNIRAGMLLLIGNLFENREENVAGVVVNKLPFGAQMLFRSHRVLLGMA
jgi:uncharacterized phiE125 gp8 family phage protein